MRKCRFYCANAYVFYMNFEPRTKKTPPEIGGSEVLRLSTYLLLGFG